MTNWYEMNRKKRVRRGNIVDEFSKQDISVSLEAVEQKIKSLVKSYDLDIVELKAKHADFVNQTKEAHPITGKAVTLHGTAYDIGEKTALELDGISVYLGDEIIILNHSRADFIGKKGIAKLAYNEVVVHTNCEVIGLGFGVKAEISRHVHTYKDGDEVAKGRKGGEGFIVKLNGGN